MRESCKKCGEKFTKFGYLASDDPLCPECREKKEEDNDSSNKKSKSDHHPLSFIFGDLW